MKNEQQIQATLKRAARGAVLPEKFRSVSLLVLAPAPTAPAPTAPAPTAPKRSRWGRTLLRAVGVAAVVLVALAGLALTRAGQQVLAEAVRQLSWISIELRSLQQQISDYKGAKPPPPIPAELEQARWVDPAQVAEVRRQYGFVAPLPDGEATLKQERASRPLLLEKDGQWRIVDGDLGYVQIYRLATGHEIAVGQRFIAPPENGSFYMFNVETQETKILGHPAYVTSRHIGWDEAGKTVINEFPSVRVFMQVDGGARWLELSFRSYDKGGNQASLEQVMRLAEAFTAHAAAALAGD